MARCKQFLPVASFFVAFAALLVAARADEQFSLDVPGDPTLKSSAVLTARGLTIVDAAGRRFNYVPIPELDSANGAYLGFHNAEARQFLRWPATGEGAMYTGSGRLADIMWKKSLMQVRRIGRGGRDPVVGGPGVGVGGVGVGGVGVGGAQPQVGPMNLAVLPVGRGSFAVAHIDETGALRYYDGRDGRWQPRESALRDKLPPGAPIVLAADTGSDFPLVFAIDQRGQVVEVSEGRTLTTLSGRGDPRFNPQTHLALLSGGRAPQLAGVDERGQLWQIDTGRRGFTEIETRGGIFEPGIPLTAVSAADDELFLIDRRGNILGYSSAGRRWSRPFQVASGYASGGTLAGVFSPSPLGPDPVIQLASIDAVGRPHLLTEAVGAWNDSPIGNVRLPPGAPVGLAHDAGAMLFSTIASDGRWLEFQRRGNTWSNRAIADGFATGAQVFLAPQGPSAFAIDRTGRLIASRFLNNAWESAILSPRFAFAPRMVRREIVPNEPLPPVALEFENLHKEELVLRIHNLAAPQRPIEVSILPGKSALQRIERDAGATLEEVYLVPGPRGEVVEEVHRIPLPPKKLYDVVAYANRVTSVYFDRTKGKKSTVPDESSLSLVSLGVFPIPPGPAVSDGDKLDVYREAQAQRNPGAAALLDGNPGGK